MDDSTWPRSLWITVVGRFCFTLIFFISGVTHFTDVPGYVDLMPAEVPWREFWVLASGVVELAGAVMILFNWQARLGAWLLVLFLIPVTIVVHGVGVVVAETDLMSQIQTSFFLKGVAMTGGALLISQFGVRHPENLPLSNG